MAVAACCGGVRTQATGRLVTFLASAARTNLILEQQRILHSTAEPYPSNHHPPQSTTQDEDVHVRDDGRVSHGRHRRTSWNTPSRQTESHPQLPRSPELFALPRVRFPANGIEESPNKSTIFPFTPSPSARLPGQETSIRSNGNLS
ncbi:hypothetical protein PtA15_7A761 [Puccinia triticina]|uniref:Secreted protein n=1 Tax=Puccinia triticina TaxID=208348 RepID=A0ABY7CST7_9BASI|nr:uncharacterized protein PtA15_7A761 [Puccinia triticina]WAQ87032.1 hypothetical protein PtA15_7A761 [Puccinia triticina]